ncbi:MAG: PilZ domain-containing protein [Planctomycetota bacterium]|jgi:hypothetical protein
MMSQLGSHRIDRIIDIARGVAPVGPGERENREATRIPYASYIALMLINSTGRKATPVVLTSENISSGGLCVMSDLELPVGGRGAILLQKSDGDSVLLGARVVYVNAVDTNSFECGLEFEIPPAAASMDDFTDPAGNLPRIGPAQAA